MQENVKLEVIMDKINRLKALINKFEDNLAYYHNNKKHYNEHSCRIEYIDPLLKLLGGMFLMKKQYYLSTEKLLPRIIQRTQIVLITP